MKKHYVRRGTDEEWTRCGMHKANSVIITKDHREVTCLHCIDYMLHFELEWHDMYNSEWVNSILGKKRKKTMREFADAQFKKFKQA